MPYMFRTTLEEADYIIRIHVADNGYFMNITDISRYDPDVPDEPGTTRSYVTRAPQETADTIAKVIRRPAANYIRTLKVYEENSHVDTDTPLLPTTI